MRYAVYWNRPNKKAKIHQSTCGALKMHGGVSLKVPPTGGYYEGLPNLEEAERVARRTGYNVSRCGLCSP